MWNIIIRDTEYTTWKGCHETFRDPSKNQWREIVQAGFVRLDADTLEEIESRLRYITPQQNTILSDYFIWLTWISQEIVDEKWIPFTTFDRECRERIGDDPILSFGGDYLIYAENCGYDRIPCMLSAEQCFDVRGLFGKIAYSMSSGTIHQHYGLQDQEIEHDALWDAKNIARTLRHIQADVKSFVYTS